MLELQAKSSYMMIPVMKQVKKNFYLNRWVFFKNKGYQVKDDTIESSVVTKVKGVARVNTTDSNLWGPEDYVFPSQVSLTKP